MVIIVYIMSERTLKPACILNHCGFYRIKEYIPVEYHTIFTDCLYDVGFCVSGPKTGDNPRCRLGISKRRMLRILTSFSDSTGDVSATDALIRGFRDVCNFSLDAKHSPEENERRRIYNKSFAERENKTTYEKYQKPRLEKLKITYPGVPLYILVSGEKRIQEYLKKQ